MADTKVELVVNDEKKNEVTVSEITSVEIRGATGVATYRLDPMQDTVIKLVVVGKVAQEDDLEAVPVQTENIVAHFGKPEDVKNLKEREAKVQKDAEEEAAKNAKAAEAAQKETEKEEKETVSVGTATHRKS